MLTTTREMLLLAQEGGYAVGAFNVENMEMVQAVIDAAERLQSPVILQTTSSTLKYASPELYFVNVKAVADKAKVPVAIHLDHGSGFAISMQCLRAGYTSIMIDGSHEVFEDNIAITKQVADACQPMGVPCEGELGRVGGKEDDVESDGDEYTDPKEAAEFVERTGVTSLAVGIGTAHGVYKHAPVLNVDRLSEIRKTVSVPLVLHGASGLTDEAVRECIRRGICKVNFATELRQAYTNAVRAELSENAEIFDPKAYGKAAREAVCQLVMNRIQVMGSAGKA